MKKTLYIFQNGKLSRKDNTLYFESEQSRKVLPVEDINDIFIFGEVDVSKRFLEFVSQKEICVHYFNHYGYYVGTFYPREHLNAGAVVIKQAEHYLDEGKRQTLAKTFIEGSIGQMIRVLKYYASRIENGKNEELVNTCEILSEHCQRLNACQSIEELMAVEGNSRERYYQMFDWIIDNKDFPFEKRSKRPPLNRLNALISFGNSLCYITVLSEIYKTYLDPRIGYLHATNFRRFTLNLDVAEIFKPIFVDRLIFKLINKKMINKSDFDKKTRGILLNEKGKKTFVAALDERLKTTVNHRHLGRSVSYRRLIRLELYKIQKHLLEEIPYEPYQSLW